MFIFVLFFFIFIFAADRKNRMKAKEIIAVTQTFSSSAENVVLNTLRLWESRLLVDRLPIRRCRFKCQRLICYLCNVTLIVLEANDDVEEPEVASINKIYS